MHPPSAQFVPSWANSTLLAVPQLKARGLSELPSAPFSKDSFSGFSVIPLSQPIFRKLKSHRPFGLSNPALSTCTSGPLLSNLSISWSIQDGGT